MEVDKDIKLVKKPDFLHLPPEIHEYIIRYSGVNDVYSLTLVNHFLNNVVRSKLRDFLVAGCQNGNTDRLCLYLKLQTILRILTNYMNFLKILRDYGKSRVQYDNYTDSENALYIESIGTYSMIATMTNDGQSM